VENPPPPEAASPPPAPARRRTPRDWLALAARIVEVATIAAAVGALGLWCSIPDTARLADHNPTSTAFIDLRRAEADAAGKPFTLRWQWRPLGSISRYLRAAVIYAEDYNFYRHDGVDWDAIEHAVAADWNKGAMAVGGSTITQQLAKNLYLSPRRSFVRKLREALIAFSLEDDLSKQRILELYLNVVEWGDGVFGAEAAARTWFHHAAQSLTPAEAIRLAIALPNPIARAPNIRDAELTKKAVRLVRLLRMQGLLNAAQERTALDEVGAPGERVLPDREVAAARPAAPAHEDEPRTPTPASAEAPPASANAEPPPNSEPPPPSSGSAPADDPGPPSSTTPDREAPIAPPAPAAPPDQAGSGS
jgi:monofunctional biosynthetic peptidoglycan transglycosylase